MYPKKRFEKLKSNRIWPNYSRIIEVYETTNNINSNIHRLADTFDSINIQKGKLKRMQQLY